MARRDWYRKLEIREQGAFAMLPAYVRGLYSMLLKFADDDGRIPFAGRDAFEAVGRRIGAEVGERRMLRRDLPLLEGAGKLRRDPDAWVVLELAEDAPAEGAQPSRTRSEPGTRSERVRNEPSTNQERTEHEPGTKTETTSQDHSDHDPPKDRRGKERKGEESKGETRSRDPLGSSDQTIQNPQTAPKADQPIQTALPIPGAEPATPEGRAREVFDAYLDGWRKRRGNGPPPRLDAKRRSTIAARLRDFPLADLIAAARGIWLSDWNVENKRTGFDLALRDSEHIERFRDLALAAKGQADRSEYDGIRRPRIERRPPDAPPGEVMSRPFKVPGVDFDDGAADDMAFHSPAGMAALSRALFSSGNDEDAPPLGPPLAATGSGELLAAGRVA